MIILKPDFLRKLGAQMVTLIVKRTQSGYDVNDQNFKRYSSLPFAMPAGAMTKRTRTSMEADEELSYFSTKTGATWVVIKRGYATYKRYIMKNATSSGGVNLTVTGNMLRSIGIKSVSVNNIKLGFNRTEEAEKAVWNIAKGRNFFGLSPKDINKLSLKDFGIQSISVN